MAFVMKRKSEFFHQNVHDVRRTKLFPNIDHLLVRVGRSLGPTHLTVVKKSNHLAKPRCFLLLVVGTAHKVTRSD